MAMSLIKRDLEVFLGNLYLPSSESSLSKSLGSTDNVCCFAVSLKFWRGGL